MSVDLNGELRRLALGTTGFAIRRLLALGVDRTTLARMGRHHYSFGVGKCLDLGEGMFCPEDEGQVRLVLPVYDAGDLVDLVALSTDTPGDTRLRTGDGWALGLEDGFDRFAWDEPLALHLTALDWLKADCMGLCVLDWASPQVARLKDFASIECGDARIKSLLTSAWSRTARLPQITVSRGYQHAA